MKKQDIIILVALFALWLAWPIIDRQVIKKYFFHDSAAPAAAEPASDVPGAVTDAALGEAPATLPADEATEAAPAKVEAEPEEDALPEETAVLENEAIKLTVSSRGASVKSVEFKERDYRQTVDPDSGPLVLDFDGVPALAYVDWAGLSARQQFAMTVAEDGRSVRFERATPDGLKFVRTISLDDRYMAKVTDEMANESAAAVRLPPRFIQTGMMQSLVGDGSVRGIAFLGVDTLSPGGEGVKYWGTKLVKQFDVERKERNLAKPPVTLDWSLAKPVHWAAAKNKYFVQILAPENGGENSVIHAVRDVSPQEMANPAARVKTAVVKEVSSRILLPEFNVEPGTTFTLPMEYYVGPKKYSELNRYGQRFVDVMEFGMWAPVGKVLLATLNALHRVFRNYGVAIMLLTIIIRVVFWPITRKSTESMKKMSEIQPLVAAVREKYKDNAQKQQQEIMALYKEHKVNPLGGCLPTLIQIPVFIALFVVLRSAIELRFAPFLWVRDLSQPENLLAGLLPIPLNILPIIMAVTMVWQQKLTPSAGDASQQKMMMVMPVMMLVIFYNFAAGLALYWTTNQCLMIAQQLMMHRKKKAAGA